MSLAQKLSRNAKATRVARGLSQQELADKAGLTVRYISRLENSSPNITLEVLERLAEALDCSVYQLIEEDVGVSDVGAYDVLEQSINLLQSLKTRLKK